MRQIENLLQSLPAWLPIWNAANLENRLGELHARAQALLVLAEEEQRALTLEEQQEFDVVASQFDVVEAQLKQQQKNEQTLARLDPRQRGTGRLTTAQGPSDDRTDFLRTDGAVDPAHLHNLQREPLKGRSQVELFGRQTERSPFASVDEFLSIIANNQFDPRLVRNVGMSEGVDTDGGYLVPVEYSSRMLDAALEQSVLFPRVRVEPMTSREKLVGTFDSSDNSTSKPYGLTLQWLAEGGTFSESKAKTRQIRLIAKKCGVLVPFTSELGEDSPGFAGLLQGAVSSGLGWGIDDAIINGTGAGQPLGILNSPCLITVAEVGGQLADTIVYENIASMYSRMHPGSVGNAVWLANPSTLPQLLTMSIPLGASAGFYPVLNETNGSYSLLGRPLLLTEKCDQLGDKGDLLFVDPLQYLLGLRRQLTIALDPYSKFASDEIQLKVTTRIDGQPAVGNVFTMKNGGTVSPFVAIESR